MCLHAAPSPKAKSFLKSIIIPGWGEVSNGDKTGYIHFAAEILLFSTKYYYQNQADVYNTNAEDCALKYSGIESMNITNQHKVDLGKYDSSGYGPNGYNAYILQSMHYDYPDLTEQEQIDFLAEHTYSDELGWDWDSGAHRAKYRVYRKKNMDFKDKAKVMTSAIIMNHLASGIHSMFSSARKANKNKQVKFGVSTNKDDNLLLTAIVRF